MAYRLYIGLYLGYVGLNLGYISDVGLYMGLYMKVICMELCITILSKLCLHYIGYSSMLHRL